MLTLVCMVCTVCMVIANNTEDAMPTAPMSALEASQSESPRVRLLAACAWAQMHGYRVVAEVPHHGITCVSSHARVRWVRDPADGAIDPIGAAVLQHMPEVSDIHRAIEIATGMGIAESEGFLDGLTRQEPSAGFVKSSARALYMGGFEGGAIFRAYLAGRLGAFGGVGV